MDITNQKYDECTAETSSRSHGCLTQENRRAIILRYKCKMAERRKHKPICKKFTGRSRVAAFKLRVNGKFVKKQHQQLLLVAQSCPYSMESTAEK